MIAIQTARRLLCYAVIAAAASLPALRAMELTLDVANIPGSEIEFTGNTDTFQFSTAGGNNIHITGVTDGAGDASGKLGAISGTFTIGAITVDGSSQTAPVTGTGTLVLHDGVGNDLTASLTWVDIGTLGTGGTMNLLGALNLTSISYSGPVVDFQTMAAEGVGILVATFQFPDARSLSQLTANGSVSRGSFSATLTVPLTAAIGDFVWLDANNNGIQDAGEAGVPGVTVRLLDCSGNVLAATTTDANGYYLFSKLTPGSYSIQFVKPSGYVFSPANQGADDAKDSDADTTTGMTTCTLLSPGETDRTWDAGLYVPQAPGTGTPGYWMNHPEAWPVSSIVIGGITYSRDQAISIMWLPVKTDKRYTMFPALVCAMLNLLVGNDDSCIAATIVSGNAWWATYNGSPVKASSYAWQAGGGGTIAGLLDNYNNGLLPCAQHRN